MKMQTGQTLSSHYYLTLIYYDCALEPSEVILLMAGAQPNKANMRDTAYEPRPFCWYTGLKYRFGWWRIMLFDVNDYLDRRDKRLCRNTSHVMMLA